MTSTKGLTDQLSLLECFYLKGFLPKIGCFLTHPYQAISNNAQCTLTPLQHANAVGWSYDG